MQAQRKLGKLLRQRAKLDQAIAELEKSRMTAEVEIFVAFLKIPSRGLCRPSLRVAVDSGLGID